MLRAHLLSVALGIRSSRCTGGFDGKALKASPPAARELLQHCLWARVTEARWLPRRAPPRTSTTGSQSHGGAMIFLPPSLQLDSACFARGRLASFSPLRRVSPPLLLLHLPTATPSYT